MACSMEDFLKPQPIHNSHRQGGVANRRRVPDISLLQLSVPHPPAADLNHAYCD